MENRLNGKSCHEIAENLSKRLGVKLYDRAMLDEICARLNVDPEVLRPYEEKPRNFLFTRRIGKHSNSMEEILAEDVPALYIQDPIQIYVTDSSLDGFRTYPINIFRMDLLEYKQEPDL